LNLDEILLLLNTRIEVFIVDVVIKVLFEIFVFNTSLLKLLIELMKVDLIIEVPRYYKLCIVVFRSFSEKLAEAAEGSTAGLLNQEKDKDEHESTNEHSTVRVNESREVGIVFKLLYGKV
jgi:hypothetical protein